MDLHQVEGIRPTQAVAAQETDPTSTLHLYRDALHLRRRLSELGDGSLEWIEDVGPEVLAFRRGESFVCVVNTGEKPVSLPVHDVVLLSSVPLDGGRLPGNATAWLQTQGDAATTAIPAATSTTSTTTNNTTEG